MSEKAQPQADAAEHRAHEAQAAVHRTGGLCRFSANKLRQAALRLGKTGADGKWRPSATGLLVIGAIVYAVLLIGYFVTESTALKYMTTWLGILLLPLAPEVTKDLRTLVLVMAPIAAGIAAVQIRDDIAKEKAIEAARIQQALKLDVQEAERKVREKDLDLVMKPRDAAAALRNAPRGLRLKADRLALSAAVVESRLLASQPQRAAVLLAGAHESDTAALAFYRRLAAQPGSASVATANAVAALLAQASAYRALANEITADAVPVYESVVSDIDKRAIGTPDARKRLGDVEARLTERIGVYPIAGLFTHLGVLAMAQGVRDRALARYYDSIALDREHIPGYYGVAYGAWALNMEPRTAVRYAEKGLRLADAYREQVERDYQQIVANYAALASDNPGLEAALRKRRSQIGRMVNGLLGAPVQGMIDHLQLIYAYCSALELINEKRARAYSRRLYESDEKDGDYQDARGLVLMMFSRNTAELDEAGTLFTSALGNNTSEEMTQELARSHLDKLVEKRRRLGLSR